MLCNRHFIHLLPLILGIGMQMPMYAAVSTATITANIIKPVSLNTQSGLEFADVSSNKSAGTITLSPNGSRVATGGADIKSAESGGPATFKVQGEPNAVYTIKLPESAVLSNPSGGTMVINKFTSLPATAGKIDANGEQILSVGATLNVGSNQNYGSYAGTMVVTIQYN
ncbi:MAG: DUF4402 domain-containing protein [Gammaproteobacteria bacterium]|nr:DUF4402 domain-containing protein [Gammaproteobacteria bacterium]